MDATYPGASHDSFIWGNSEVSEYFKNIYNNGDTNQKLLGKNFYLTNCCVNVSIFFFKADAGYPLLPWLITPFKNAGVNTSKSRFNKSHSSGRNIVERTIGVWKNWCRCLLGVARHLHYTPDKAVKIINVAAALHNIRIHFNVPDYDEPIEQQFQEDDEITDHEIQPQEDQRYYTEANEFRNQILLNF